MIKKLSINNYIYQEYKCKNKNCEMKNKKNRQNIKYDYITTIIYFICSNCNHINDNKLIN
jgi:hypothetical protein